MSMNRHALIIEFHNHHGHILYAQCRMLVDAGYAVTLVVSDQNPDLPALEQMDGPITIRRFTCGNQLSCLLRLLTTLRRERYEFALFNTLPESQRHAVFMFLQPHPIRYIVHNTNYPRGRALNWLDRLFARRVERVFVLSQSVYQHYVPALPAPQRAKLSYFHPAYFPSFPGQLPADFNAGERIVFAIPGGVHIRRRNYRSLVDSFAQIANSPLADQIEIHLMGDPFTPYGQELIFAALDNGLLGSVIQLQRDAFEPSAVYIEKLRASHFILPLIDQQVRKQYSRNTTPSSVMLSRGLAVPLLSSADLPLDDDLLPFTIQYDDLFTGLQQAVELFHSADYNQRRARYEQARYEAYAISQANYLGHSHEPAN